jgi:hypothetical protein
MLRTAKLALLGGAGKLGLTKLVLNSGWRSRRLLILCYHGVSLDDEHEWDSSLYMHRDLFRRRMQTLVDLRCNVLPLQEALERVRNGTLPPRSVAITFDDGSYDFYRLSWPILKFFGFPVTLYFTTYYSDFNRPVFDVMCGLFVVESARRHPRLARCPLGAAQLDDAGRAAQTRRSKPKRCATRCRARKRTSSSRSWRNGWASTMSPSAAGVFSI